MKEGEGEGERGREEKKRFSYLLEHLYLHLLVDGHDRAIVADRSIANFPSDR